jgi:hypothetical protein
MKISNLILLLALLVAVSSCKLPTYVPNVVDAAESVYGGYIKVKLVNGRKIKGELLASNNQRITIMIEGLDYPTQIATEGILNFELQFAKSGLSGFAYANLPLAASHGKFGILTIPLNALIVTGIVRGSNEDYKVFSETTSYQELSTYARYPQGLPPVYLKNSLDK